jgi:hypothetical protein
VAAQQAPYPADSPSRPPPTSVQKVNTAFCKCGIEQAACGACGQGSAQQVQITEANQSLGQAQQTSGQMAELWHPSRHGPETRMVFGGSGGSVRINPDMKHTPETLAWANPDPANVPEDLAVLPPRPETGTVMDTRAPKPPTTVAEKVAETTSASNPSPLASLNWLHPGSLSFISCPGWDWECRGCEYQCSETDGTRKWVKPRACPRCGQPMKTWANGTVAGVTMFKPDGAEQSPREVRSHEKAVRSLHPTGHESPETLAEANSILAGKPEDPAVVLTEPKTGTVVDTGIPKPLRGTGQEGAETAGVNNASEMGQRRTHRARAPGRSLHPGRHEQGISGPPFQPVGGQRHTEVSCWVPTEYTKGVWPPLSQPDQLKSRTGHMRLI